MSLFKWEVNLNTAIRSHLSALCAGYQVLQRHFPFVLSISHSSLMFQTFISLLTVSFHRNLSLPTGRFPSIFISISSNVPEPLSFILMTTQMRKITNSKFYVDVKVIALNRQLIYLMHLLNTETPPTYHYRCLCIALSSSNSINELVVKPPFFNSLGIKGIC